jgi:hypothetical protein
MRDILRRILGWKASATMPTTIDIQRYTVPVNPRLRSVSNRMCIYDVQGKARVLTVKWNE